MLVRGDCAQGRGRSDHLTPVGPPDRASSRASGWGEGPGSHPTSTTNGPALFAAVVEAELEGIVAKRLTDPYRPGERGWLKAKNRSYWRFQQEREFAQSRRRQRLTI